MARRARGQPESPGAASCTVLYSRLGSMVAVLGKAFKIVSLACLAGLCLLYPFIELLDRWDAPGPSSDSEIQIIVLSSPS